MVAPDQCPLLSCTPLQSKQQMLPTSLIVLNVACVLHRCRSCGMTGQLLTAGKSYPDNPECCNVHNLVVYAWPRAVVATSNIYSKQLRRHIERQLFLMDIDSRRQQHALKPSRLKTWAMIDRLITKSPRVKHVHRHWQKPSLGIQTFVKLTSTTKKVRHKVHIYNTR